MIDLPPLSYTKLAMVLVLAVLAIVIVRSLIARDRNAHSKLNLEDMLLDEHGKLSSIRVVMLGSFGLTSWIMVYLTLTKGLTEGYFTAYMGVWVIPIVARVIKGPKRAKPKAD